MLNSQYPIIALAMNQVSDMPFAIACAEAGVYPSVSTVTYHTASSTDYHRLVDDLILFKKARGNCDVMFSVYHRDMRDKALFKILKAAGVTHLELVMPWGNYKIAELIAEIQAIKDYDFTIMMRSIEFNKNEWRQTRNGTLYPYFDMLLLKGNKGAGAVGPQSVEEMFFIAKYQHPDKMLVPAGGIGTAQQMKFFIENGATAVGIGTLFAASVESCLSQETKEKMVQAEFAHVKEKTHPEKNSLVFKHLPKTSDLNHTLSLKLGIKRPDLGGHIYCGAGVDNINSILTLKEIVQKLVT
ncbi:MAG: nitronate monooxygenase [Candidatus Bathyarchaeia archaeon]